VTAESDSVAVLSDEPRAASPGVGDQQRRTSTSIDDGDGILAVDTSHEIRPPRGIAVQQEARRRGRVVDRRTVAGPSIDRVCNGADIDERSATGLGVTDDGATISESAEIL